MKYTFIKNCLSIGFKNFHAISLGLYGLELNSRIYRGLYDWLSVDVLSSKGRSQSCGYKTKIVQVPIGLGLKYIPHIDRYTLRESKF